MAMDDKNSNGNISQTQKIECPFRCFTIFFILIDKQISMPFSYIYASLKRDTDFILTNFMLCNKTKQKFSDQKLIHP